MFRKISMIAALLGALALPADALAGPHGWHGGGGWHGGHGGWHGGYGGWRRGGWGYRRGWGYGGNPCWRWWYGRWVWVC